MKNRKLHINERYAEKKRIEKKRIEKKREKGIE